MKHYGLTIAQGSNITNLTAPAGTQDPTEPHIGEMFFRTDEDVLRLYTAEGWLSVATPVYDIGVIRVGGVNDDEFIMVVVAVRPFKILNNGHQRYATTPPTVNDAVMTIRKNGVSVGTVVFIPGNNSLSSETIEETTFDTGDRLDVICTISNGIEDFSFTLVGRWL